MFLHFIYYKFLNSEVMKMCKILCFADNVSSTIKIKDIYKIDEQKDELLRADYGLWDAFNGMVTYEANIFRRRSDFQGHVLRYFYDCLDEMIKSMLYCDCEYFYHKAWFYISYRFEASKWLSYISYIEDGCNSSKCFEGTQADVLHLLQQELNFTYQVVARDDPVGRRQVNGSWNGVIGIISLLVIIRIKNVTTLAEKGAKNH